MSLLSLLSLLTATLVLASYLYARIVHGPGLVSFDTLYALAVIWAGHVGWSRWERRKGSSAQATNKQGTKDEGAQGRKKERRPLARERARLAMKPDKDRQDRLRKSK
jgi:hypothetical protein